MKKFRELTDEIEEAVMKRLDLAKLRKRSKEQSIRMRRLMKNPAYKKKVELKKKRMKSTPELLVRAQKKARDTVRKKFYPKYDEMGREGKAKINQMVSLKHGPKISKIAKRLPLDHWSFHLPFSKNRLPALESMPSLAAVV